MCNPTKACLRANSLARSEFIVSIVSTASATIRSRLGAKFPCPPILRQEVGWVPTFWPRNLGVYLLASTFWPYFLAMVQIPSPRLEIKRLVAFICDEPFLFR